MNYPLLPHHHGTLTGYRYGCRDICCTRARKRDRVHRDRGEGKLVSSEATHRKIRSLMALGWTILAQAEYLGVHKTVIAGILRKDKMRQATVDRFDAMYRELHMKLPPDTRDTTRVRNYARRQGWLPPLAWEDIDTGERAVLPHRLAVVRRHK